MRNCNLLRLLTLSGFLSLVVLPRHAAAQWPTLDISSVKEGISTNIELVKQSKVVTDAMATAGKINAGIGDAKASVSKFAGDNLAKAQEKMKKLQEEKERIEKKKEEYEKIKKEIEEEPETPSDALVENTYLSAQTEEEQLSNLLNRLDMAEPIKRMNESAQEDMADVIERDEEKVELSEALPLKPSKSTLPKYQKPKFDFDIQPVSIPLDDQYSNISEYDEVPTIHDLENQWKDDSKPIIETVATSMEEAPQTFNTLEASDTPEAVDFTVPPEEIEPEQEVHSEEIVRKNGIGKRSYHKITIR